MTEPRQRITITIDAQELDGTQTALGQTMRKEITPDGALGIANHTGILDLRLNGKPAVRLWLHEDRMGHAVISVIDVPRDTVLGTVDVELYDLVPPRRGARVHKDRRFGDVRPS